MEHPSPRPFDAMLEATDYSPLDSCQGMISSLETQIKTIRREQQVQANVIQQANNTNRELQLQLNMLQLQLDATHLKFLAEAQCPRPVLPAPEKFTGTIVKFNTWVAAIRAKLRIDAEAIGDAQAQFYYVYLNLGSRVQAVVLPQIEYAETSGNHDYNAIIHQLANLFEISNNGHEAEDGRSSYRTKVRDLAATTQTRNPLATAMCMAILVIGWIMVLWG
ncbi:hypothetical protein N7509_001357 [Penicillium cosmopolitanum]|uniref:Uncharacterized protein n=1 Tax=Penicillium cosmopolitanum TaxID=1131564 RepID=A0A9W9WBY1_9EURO|nr:uncharacterized protein N7509_001357 [Penicillium cosmopolitanum]KAJ5414730.1 hypothetical protein N7509_001357 [Penicillium cosmopolitanum]